MLQLPSSRSLAFAITGTHVTFHNSSQGPSFVRLEMARLLGWPENKVRIKVGAWLRLRRKTLYQAGGSCARAVDVAHRPVKVAATFDVLQITRHPATVRIKSGVDEHGKIVARKCEIYWNGGAYADIGPRVTQKAGLTASGPYDIDNVAVNSGALPQRHAGRRRARLRRAAARMGL